MAMLRPKGKALKIAKKVILGLKSKKEDLSLRSKNKLPRDEVELTVMNINDNLGKKR